MTRGLIEDKNQWSAHGGGVTAAAEVVVMVDDLPAIRSPSESGNLLDSIHDQELAVGIVGFCIPEAPWPVLLAAHLSQYAILSL